MPYKGFLLLVALIGSSPGFAAEKHGNFSGTWEMDAARSESAHQEVPAKSATLVIHLTDSDVSIETTRTEGDAPRAFHERLYFRLDGSETTSTGDGGATVVGKARWDGPKLVLETARNINDATVSTTYIHSLTPDGKSMTVEKTLTVQHGYQGRTGMNTGSGKDVFVRVSK